jgi:YfiR/HmsC-like
VETLSRPIRFFLCSLPRLALGWVFVLALIPPAMLYGAAPAAASVRLSEYEVKAAYLLKFVRYVEWPAESFPSANSAVVIGVLGANPFDDVLDRSVNGMTINDRPVQVRHLENLEEAAQCHLVFIARDHERDEAVWLRALRNRPVLTVTESDQGLKRGAVLSFVLEYSGVGTKVRFSASLPAAQLAGLKLSASMLDSAKQVLRQQEEQAAAP